METYTGFVNFAGYIGADEEYTVSAENEDEAIYEMLELAKEDLEVIEVNQLGEGEYEVVIGFAGFYGVEEFYTVYVDSEDEAEDEALSQAFDDLSAEITDHEEDEEDEEDF